MFTSYTEALLVVGTSYKVNAPSTLEFGYWFDTLERISLYV
jgi:hypothetical protein